ncbi:nuclear transport factor 2 family protein [Rhizobium ruizarguesonis]|uniref:nuclear transport factor 2 family protein n=1 Tax=Rhizobium ruizarguesonis TaxID=2081791 RepID=UPI001952F6C7|nr:hypothetical protein [Rhizobium ruizarguesonis]
MKLEDGEQTPLWVGSISDERIYRPLSLVTAVSTQPDFTGPREALARSLREGQRSASTSSVLKMARSLSIGTIETPAAANPSGNTMIDGPTEPTDLPKTEENKTLVLSFVDDILVNGRTERLTGYFDGDNYVQHNPQIANGLSGLGAALEAMAANGVTMKYDTIHQMLGEGNLC